MEASSEISAWDTGMLTSTMSDVSSGSWLDVTW